MVTAFQDDGGGSRLVRSQQFGGMLLTQRMGDGYVDATGLCRQRGKKLNHYLENKGTQELIEALASDTGIPASDLVQVRKGNQAGGPRGNGQGTWLHPDLAIDFARWACPRFALQVARWVRELIVTGKVELDPQASAQVAHEVELVRGELAQVQNRLDAIPATLAEIVSRAVAEALVRVNESGPLTGVETVASRLEKLLPHWRADARQRSLIRNRARASIRRAMGREPLYDYPGSQLEYPPDMHYYLDAAIWYTYREACRDNEVDDFGLFRDEA